jgi:hypothetical protein
MNACEHNMRFRLIDGFLDSFSYGLGWVHGHASTTSFVGPWLCPCDASIGSSHGVPFRDSHHFSNDCLILFLELTFWHIYKGDSNTLFSNQILHLANPHDVLSTFVLYPSLGFPSIYWLTLWDPRLGHLSLSLLSYVGRRIRDGERELWWPWSFAWSDWDVGGSPYPCSWPSIPRVVMWHLHFVSFLIHSILCLRVIWNLFLWSLDYHSMYYNCSILHLASCAGEVC